jgi:hypothetical protein
MSGPKTTSTTTRTSYQTQSFYLGQPTLNFGEIQTGYAKFVRDGEFFFAVYNPDGSLYLGSSAYTLEELRDNAFLSVVQSIEDANCYRVIEGDDLFYCQLTDVNGIELARSGAYPSFTEAFKNTPNGRVRSEVNLY